MSQYATLDDLNRLGIAPAALRGLDDGTKEAALTAASSLADGYLRSQFVLPLSSWGDDLRRAVVGIATYDLISHRGYDPERLGNEVLRERYDDAIRWLERVAAGTISPAGITDAEPETDNAAPIVYTPPRRMWLW